MEKVEEAILYLRAKGLRVDAIGWQAHVPLGWKKEPNSLADLADLITGAHAQQVEVLVTENNIELPAKAAPDEEESEAQTFGAIIRVLLEHRNTGVVAWNCWHVRDYDSDRDVPKSAAPKTAGLLWRKDGTPGNAYYAVNKLLENPTSVLSQRRPAAPWNSSPTSS